MSQKVVEVERAEPGDLQAVTRALDVFISRSYSAVWNSAG